LQQYLIEEIDDWDLAEGDFDFDYAEEEFCQSLSHELQDGTGLSALSECETAGMLWKRWAQRAPPMEAETATEYASRPHKPIEAEDTLSSRHRGTKDVCNGVKACVPDSWEELDA
jgi:hypothetical protein